MGLNYYLNTILRYHEDDGTIHRDCHVGKRDYLDIIDICRFFISLLERISNKEALYHCKYLKRLNKAVKHKDDYPNSPLVYNSKFDNLPQTLVNIYEFIINSGCDLVSQVEYGEIYDFKEHILKYCVDNTQKEFGGLRYNTYTNFC